MVRMTGYGQDTTKIQVLINMATPIFAKDKNHVYYLDKILEGVNPKDFILPTPDIIDF